jgi:hypothetical protein
MQNNQSEVSVAFEILLNEIEDEIDYITGIGEKSFKDKNSETAKEAANFFDRITKFRDKIIDIQKEWENLYNVPVVKKIERSGTIRRNMGRLRQGMRTPERTYYVPILESLIEMGGSANAKEVIEHVGQKMRNILKEIDHEKLGSDNNQERWTNTTRWARNDMINEGLLKKDSPHGTWEISERGREYLKNSRQRLDN